MRAIQALDQVQLRRIDDAIARIRARSPGDQLKAACLLAALENEKTEVLRYHSRKNARFRPVALAA